jgi:hypothetical protein
MERWEADAGEAGIGGGGRKQKRALRYDAGASLRKADDGVRTHDPQLGKLMLYQLSYVRVPRL